MGARGCVSRGSVSQHTCGMSTLHVTNGDSVAGSLIEAGFGDAVLPWRDVLHDGPVPGGLDAEALRNVRAQFIAERGWASFERALADLTGRDAQLAACGAGDKLVLWFEPDLYDQLQLMQILTQMYLRPLANRPDITIVASDELLGPLSVKELAKYESKQRVVSEVYLELAASAWEAFSPRGASQVESFESPLLSSKSYASDELAVLPHMVSALARLAQEHPTAPTGLSRTERQTLEVLLTRPHTMADLYRAAHAPKEDIVWLGDWSFAWYVERLMLAKHPLIKFSDGTPAALGELARDGELFWKRTVEITGTGRAVVAGELNAIALNGIDRWIGGRHIVQVFDNRA